MQMAISKADQDAFLHTWRYIGYLLGIRDEFNPCATRDFAREFARELYRSVPLYTPSQASVLLVCPLLHAV